MKKLLLLIIALSSTAYSGSEAIRSLAYSENNTIYKYNLYKLDAVHYKLNLTTSKDNKTMGSSDLYLYHPVKQFFSADVNNDGRQEIAIGIIKKTRYDKRERLRPFFYRISGNSIAPLWLGSKLGGELVDFKPVTISAVTYIKTMEKNRNKYSVLLFKWYNFGFKFIKYIEKDTIYNKAKKSFAED